MFGLNSLKVNLQSSGLAYSVRRALFNNNEQGLWYDLNDDATIFQDSAGTTLATWGDPVGLTLDKSRWDGRGVVNRLLRTQEFDNASWQKTNASVTANTEVAPDGTTTADTLTDDATSGPHRASQTITASTSERVFSVFAKKGTSDFVQLLVSNGSANWITVIANLDTGTIMQTGVGSTGSITSSEVTLATAGWYRIRMVGTVAGADSFRVCTVPAESGNTLSTGGSVIYSGSGSTIHVWGAQLELGSTATAYQANGASVGGAGNHSIQSTAGSRPIRGRMPKRGRVNLLAATQRFDDAYWNKTGTGTGSAPVVTANDAIAPDGTLTADRVDFNRGAGNTGADDSVLRRQAIAVTSATVHNGSFYAKAATGLDVGKQIAFRHVAGGSYLVITLTADWQRVDRAETSFAASVDYQIAARGTITVDNTVSAHLWGAQLETGSTATNYQHVIDSLGFNVTETGQPSCGYLSYNGSNQWMQTAAAVDFSATDEMSVFAGVRKVSDAARGMLIELGNLTTPTLGSFMLNAPRAAAANVSYGSYGTTGTAEATAASITAPLSFVCTGLSEIASDTSLIRVNGTQRDSSASDQGTGNYGNHILYFGARIGTSLFFNGLMFSTIIRGALTSGTLLTRTEQYVARQTPTVNL